jgi:glycopeptide antibiotics resistance protein
MLGSVGAMWALAVMVLTVGISRGTGSTINLQLGHLTTRWALEDDVNNVIMFLPAGMLLALAGARWRATLLVGLLGSLAIEITQYVAHIGRVSDVNDLLTNTVGALLGHTLVRVLQRMARPGRTRDSVLRRSA